MVSVFLLSLLFLTLQPAHAQPYTIEVVASGLQNPRGVAFLPDGRMLLAEAGTGYDSGDPADYTGKLSVLTDHNGDGDYDDADERTAIIEQQPGYNILYQFNPGRDEIVGMGDVLALPDGRSFYTLDDHFETLSVNEVTPELKRKGYFYLSDSTLNALAYDPNTKRMYVAESTSNLLTVLSPNGDDRTLVTFDLLAHDQQPVPAGLAVDPLTGDVLVALFSGQLWSYYGEILSFMPGDAKVVRVNPQTGAVTDAITNLTTAIDVAVDEAGNIYVVEMTTEWPTPTMNHKFELYSPDAPPDAGGYARYTGRVSRYPAGGGEAVILAEDLDAPTNLTYHEGALYVSVGQGTPNRPIWVKGERRTISGTVVKITLPT
ncbi:MAG: ScyD/ScyE family protein [Chloroflexi bacterium]|nr:ScyD/ScyE family protein [Chloroflexota bacterium]MCC6897316.1 ScyD/ScyE family protein [Anaerolineae bacterium]